jgi:very-short-patch-repair endonuclease
MSLAKETGSTTTRLGIPVTTPARTLADLPATTPAYLVRRARRQAEVLGLPLGSGMESDRTRSDLEGDFLRLCRRRGLPEPEVNVRLGRWTVDFVWRGRGLVVETDGNRFHRGAQAFEDDHARDLALRRLGFTVVRLTGRQLVEEADEVVAALRGALTF